MHIGKKQLPPIGARIMKSALGAAVCVLIYYIRELLPIGSGIPFYSILAVLWCVQPYTTSTLAMAKQRSIGTFLGAAYGLVFLLSFRTLGGGNKAAVYLTACAMLVPILYTTVLLNKRNASYFSCVVFLTIAINHSFDESPYLFAFNRVLDTLIGIGVAMVLNLLHRPVKNKENTLYISGIDSVLVSSTEVMLPYNKVELNRLIALETAAASRVEAIIESEGAHAFVNVLRDNTLLIYYGDFRNHAERDLFDRLRRSPYRNYTGKQYRNNEEREKVLYIMALTPDNDAHRIARHIEDTLADTVRVALYPASEYEGYTYLKVYSRNARKDNMLKILQERIGVERVITFGSIPGQYDVYVHDDGGNAAVKMMKGLVEGRRLRDTPGIPNLCGVNNSRLTRESQFV